jgi:hypothetical protein
LSSFLFLSLSLSCCVFLNGCIVHKFMKWIVSQILLCYLRISSEFLGCWRWSFWKASCWSFQTSQLSYFFLSFSLLLFCFGLVCRIRMSKRF